MRSALILGALLALVVIAPVHAKPATHTVTGGYSYYVVDIFGDPEFYRHVSLVASTDGSAQGNWVWQRPEGTLSGPITCLIVDGQDAWVAGPRTKGTADWDAAFFWVHDGGRPSGQGDLTFGWAADPGQTLADMEALCQGMDTEFFGFDPFHVTAGNVAVH